MADTVVEPSAQVESTNFVEDAEKRLVLPDINENQSLVDRRKPIPKNVTGDFLPAEILSALAPVPPPSRELLGAGVRPRNINTSTGVSRPKPSNMWNYKNARDRYGHLLDETMCACGAGRDISFLYDVPKKDLSLPRPKKSDKSTVRYHAVEEPPKGMHLPNSLLPEEYHVVKNKGVMGLEYYEDDFTTQPVDHEKHLVQFPSTNPGSRYEVIQLKRTLEELLEKEGLTDVHESDVKGPTQMHNLIELIKKEQNIYNIVFHELIRQATVECVERGALLADLRQKYSDLLSRVPIQIKGLHEEVLAQRALDRRLTEELMRFKSTISVLTSELSEVKEHDKEVTQQAHEAQEELKQALHESQKNASLLAEYHDLYELQRKRLDQQVTVLAEEKEIWATAAYSLALKVTDECKLNTAKRLHMAEKAWHKLASHFTILLSDRDTEQMTKLSAHVERWRDFMDQIKLTMRKRDEETRQRLDDMRSSMDRLVGRFQKDIFNKEGQICHVPDDQMTRDLCQAMKGWGDVLQLEAEKFGGDELLQLQDLTAEIRQEVVRWTEYGMQVFSRHKFEDGRNYPDLDGMNKLNEQIEELLKQYANRFTGENGVATGVIHLSSSVESWLTRLTQSLTSRKPLSELDWLRFYQSLEDWLGMTDLSFRLVGETQREEDRDKKLPHEKVEISEVFRISQRWISSATNGIDSEDAKLIEQVSNYHKDLVQWLVQLLLRLAPDKAETSAEASEAALFGSATVGRLTAQARTLCLQVDTFTRYVMQCCEGIVRERVEEKKENMVENAESELRDLYRFEHESIEWQETARLLLSELTGEEVAPLLPPQKASEEKARRDRQLFFRDQEKLETTEQRAAAEAEQQRKIQQEKEEASISKPADEKPAEEATKEPESADAKEKEEPIETEKPPMIETIGHDGNTTHKPIPQIEYKDGKFTETQGDGAIQTDRADHRRSYEALEAVNKLQQQLLKTEERAQIAEERAATAEEEAAGIDERRRALERKLREAEAEIEKLKASVPAKAEKTETTGMSLLSAKSSELKEN